MLAALVVASTAAQERYEDPHGRYTTAIPSGWTTSATPDVLTLERTDPDAVMHVLAPIGSEMDVIAAALAILIDPSDLPYDVIETTFTSDDATLAGTLTLPHGDGPHPGLVVVPGSGAQDRDGMNPGMPGYTPLRWLADHLTRQGFAVLRFDERGVAASTGDHESATTADLADDVAAGLRHLADADGVDSERVGLLGHSEGSVIVGRVAAMARDDVAFMIAMAGPALPYSEIVITQV